MYVSIILLEQLRLENVALRLIVQLNIKNINHTNILLWTQINKHFKFVCKHIEVITCSSLTTIPLNVTLC